MSDESGYLYREEVEAHPLLYIVLMMVIIPLAYLSSMNPDLTGVPRMGFILVLLAMIAIYFNFSTLTIRVTSSMLSATFGVLSHRVELSNISNIAVETPPWWRYGGFGVRFEWDRSIGYLQNYRTGVRVEPVKGWTLFFSTDNPEEVVRVVETSKKAE